VRAGQVLAVVGPNGSGKSSLLRIVAGLLRPAAGALILPGRDEDKPVAHYFGHSDALKPALSLGETLRFWAAIYGEVGDIAAAAEQVGLGHALDLRAGVLSAGQRRRAGLARLLLSPRPLWLLDEPAAALDREGEAMLASLLRGHVAGGGIVIAAVHGDLPIAPDVIVDLATSA
jgi:heme exporter protein A